MNEEVRCMIAGLTNSGCTIAEIEALYRLLDAGYADDAIARLKAYRARFLEEAHGCQAKIDNVDHLIRTIDRSQH